MYRTTLHSKECIIRFSLSYRNEKEDEQVNIMEAVANLGEKLLQNVGRSFALCHKKYGMIIGYIEEGPIIDIQIQQVVPFDQCLYYP